MMEAGKLQAENSQKDLPRDIRREPLPVRALHSHWVIRLGLATIARARDENLGLGKHPPPDETGTARVHLAGNDQNPSRRGTFLTACAANLKRLLDGII
ncbi:MAG: hypothetical protein UY75_C0008G0007 [Parcubacteria group bacterium GW2011_GWC2_52_8c]|nr:MAG: hypothetical protein UY75_C0008G0007 [Parcubacteria group bacterium GW2011_GWC2_52_8c]